LGGSPLIKDLVVRMLNRAFRLFGFSLVSNQSLLMTYQHDYGPDGYEAYKNIQIFHNKRKIDQVWADEETIRVVSAYIERHISDPHGGICHGTRGGYEQAEFSKLLGCSVLGTEISDTAEQFPNTVQWDFHEQNDDWRGKFSFVYSNSLDQAFNPERALSTWIEQLDDEGLLFIEHTMSHSAGGASEMDPFGAHPMAMPYLLFEWGSGKYRMVDILKFSHEKKKDIWVFVVRPCRAQSVVPE